MADADEKRLKADGIHQFYYCANPGLIMNGVYRTDSIKGKTIALLAKLDATHLEDYNRPSIISAVDGMLGMCADCGFYEAKIEITYAEK